MPLWSHQRLQRSTLREFGRVHARADSVDKEIGSRYKFGDTCTESEREREAESERVESERRNYKERG